MDMRLRTARTRQCAVHRHCRGTSFGTIGEYLAIQARLKIRGNRKLDLPDV
jgi:hypothetical protein